MSKFIFVIEDIKVQIVRQNNPFLAPIAKSGSKANRISGWIKHKRFQLDICNGLVGLEADGHHRRRLGGDGEPHEDDRDDGGERQD